MKNPYLLLVVALAFLQAFTCVKLIETRHELRVLSGDVTMHDEMLETLGDDLTMLEQREGE
jgi:hypothetical protein